MSGERWRISELGEPPWSSVAETSKHPPVLGVGPSRGGDGGRETVEAEPALRVMRIHFSGFSTLGLSLRHSALLPTQ